MNGFIVLGPESSGNRLIQNLLVKAGCYGGAGYKLPFNQKLDYNIPYPDKPVSWLRSVPHEGNWEPNITAMASQLSNKGYTPYLVVVHRAIWCTASSLIDHYGGHIEYDEAMERTVKAWRYIAGVMDSFSGPITISSYDEIIRSKYGKNAFLNLLGLDSVDYPVKQCNTKHYRRLL